MKQYVVDELRPADYEKIKAHLDTSVPAGSVEGIYWFFLPDDLLTDQQSTHTDCRPLCFAVELEPNRLACEFLIRTRNRVRCECIAYATEAQRNWIIQCIDRMFEALDIKT